MVEPPGPPPMTSTSHWYSGGALTAGMLVCAGLAGMSPFKSVDVGRRPALLGAARRGAFYRTGTLLQVLRRSAEQRSDFARGRYCFLAAGSPGAATPIEMTYLSASSTLIWSSTTSAFRIIRKNPEVGFGVVGTYTLTYSPCK